MSRATSFYHSRAVLAYRPEKCVRSVRCRITAASNASGNSSGTRPGMRPSSPTGLGYPQGKGGCAAPVVGEGGQATSRRPRKPRTAQRSLTSRDAERVDVRPTSRARLGAVIVARPLWENRQNGLRSLSGRQGPGPLASGTPLEPVQRGGGQPAPRPAGVIGQGVGAQLPWFSACCHYDRDPTPCGRPLALAPPSVARLRRAAMYGGVCMRGRGRKIGREGQRKEDIGERGTSTADPAWYSAVRFIAPPATYPGAGGGGDRPASEVEHADDVEPVLSRAG